MSVLSIWQWVFVIAIALVVRFRGQHLLAGLLVGLIIVPCAPVVLDGILAFRNFRAIHQELAALSAEDLQSGFRSKVQEVLDRHGIEKDMTTGIHRTRSDGQVYIEVDYEVYSQFLVNAQVLFEFKAVVPVTGKRSDIAYSK